MLIALHKQARTTPVVRAEIAAVNNTPRSRNGPRQKAPRFTGATKPGCVLTTCEAVPTRRRARRRKFG